MTNPLPPAGGHDPAAAATRTYREMLANRAPDVVSEPFTVALHHYNRALERDPGGTIPRLRGRVYLTQLAFEDLAAADLLAELARLEPRNALRAFEEARARCLVQRQPDEGMRILETIPALPEFSRSFLVAVPSPLRRSLSYQRRIRALVADAWPGFSGLFDLLRGRGAATVDSREKTRFRLLGLEAAERLCRAGDYADAALGIEQRSRLLREWLASPDLDPEDRLRLVRLQEQLVAAFSAFPRTRDSIELTREGMRFSESPSLVARPYRYRGPWLSVLPTAAMMGSDVIIGSQ